MSSSFNSELYNPAMSFAPVFFTGPPACTIGSSTQLLKFDIDSTIVYDSNVVCGVD